MLRHEGWQRLVPGGEGNEGLHRTTQAGEDGSEGPGTGAFRTSPYVSPTAAASDKQTENKGEAKQTSR